MHFAVLGALRVTDGTGSEVVIRGRSRRLLLGALLARVGQPVRLDTLVDDLWGASIPPSAERTLRSHVTRLRDDLGDRDLLHAGPSGYRLVIQPEDLDSERYRTLATGGIHAAADGDLERARSQLAAAEALWRGQPFQDFGDAGFAVEQRLRVGEIRTTALETAADVALALGEGAELIPALGARVEAEPFRERVWEQLMLALYRSGRRADALAAFQRMRTLLDDELGVEPRPSAQLLHRQMLNDSPHLEDPRPSLAQLSGTAMCPYPGLRAFAESDAWVFAGREQAVSALASRVLANSMVVVTGPSGVGKSSLVRAGLVPALRSGLLGETTSWRVEYRTAPEVPASDVRADVLVVDQAEELFTLLDPEARDEADARLGAALRDGTRLVVVVRGDFYENLVELPVVGRLADRSTYVVRRMRPDELRRAIVEPAARVGLEVEDPLVERILEDAGDQPDALPLVASVMARTWARRTGSRLTVADYEAAGTVTGALEAAGEEVWQVLTPPQREACRALLVRMAERQSSGWVARPLDRSAVAEVPEGEAVLATMAGSRLLAVDEKTVTIAHEALLRAWPRLAGWLAQRALVARVLTHLETASRAWEDGGRKPEDLYRGVRLEAALEAAHSHSAELSEGERTFLDASEELAAAERAADARRAEREARDRRRMTWVAATLAVSVVIVLVAGLFAVGERNHARRTAVAAQADRLAALSAKAPDLRSAALLAVGAFHLRDDAATRGALLDVDSRTQGARWNFKPDAGAAVVTTAPGSSRLWAGVRNGNVQRIDELDPARPAVLHSTSLTGAPLLVLPGGKRVVVQDRTPASADAPQHLSLVDLPSGRTLERYAVDSLDHHTAVGAAAVSGDGRWLAFPVPDRGDFNRTPANQLALVDLADEGQPRMITTPSRVFGVFGARASFTVQGEGGRLLHLDPVSGLMTELPALPPGDVDAIAASPDGAWLALSTSDDVHGVMLRALDASGATSQMPAQHQPVNALAFGPSDQLAIGTQTGQVSVYDADGTPIAQLQGSPSAVNNLAWSTDGKQVFGTDNFGAVTAWDISRSSGLVSLSGDLVDNFGVVEQFGDLVLGVTPEHPGSADRLVSLRLHSGERETWPLGLNDVDAESVNTVDPDAAGRTALVSVEEQDGKNHYQLRDLATGRLLSHFDPPPGSKDRIPLYAALSPDGSTAYVAMDEHRIAVVSLSTGRVRRTFTPTFPGATGSRQAVGPLEFDPHGRLIVSTYDSGPKTPDVGPAPDFRLGAIDVTTDRLVATTELGNFNPSVVTFSSTGRYVAVTSGGGGGVSLRDGSTLRSLAPDVLASDGVVSASFSSDDRTLVTGDNEGSLRLWQVPTMTPIGSSVQPVASESAQPWWAWFARPGVIAGFAPVDRDNLQWATVQADPDAWVTLACRLAGGQPSASEWHADGGTGAFGHACPA